MDLHWISGVTFLGAFGGLLLVAGDTLYGSTGRSVSINPQFNGNLQDILWKHDGHKVVEWDTTSSTSPQEFREFKGKTELNTKTGEVTIKNLTSKHNGIYEAEGLIDGNVKTFWQHLEVLDPVQPEVSCELNGTTAALRCKARGPLVQYKWLGSGQEGATWSEEESGPSFSLESLQSVNYTCVARNPVSEKTKTFHNGQCPFSGKMISYKHLGVVLVIIAIILIVAIIFLIKAFIRVNPGKGRRENSESGTNIRSENTADPPSLQPRFSLSESDCRWSRDNDSLEQAESLLSPERCPDGGGEIQPGESMTEEQEEPLVNAMEKGSIQDLYVRDVNQINQTSEEGGTGETEQMETSHVTQGERCSPGGHGLHGPPPPKPPRKAGSIRGGPSPIHNASPQQSCPDKSLDEFTAARGAGTEKGEKRLMSIEEEGLDHKKESMNGVGRQMFEGEKKREDEGTEKGMHEDGKEEERDEEEGRGRVEMCGFEVQKTEEDKVECGGGKGDRDDLQEGPLSELRPDEQQKETEASTDCRTERTTNPSDNGSQTQSCPKSFILHNDIVCSKPRFPPPVAPKPVSHKYSHLTRDTVLNVSGTQDSTVNTKIVTPAPCFETNSC